MVLDDRLTDRKTHSHPAGLGREHWFKKAIEVGLINSAAGIRNRDTYGRASAKKSPAVANKPHKARGQ
jgi:hypothetical protein